MTTYQHILVAVDLTDEATQVLEQAQKIASEHGSKLTALTVIRPVNYAYSGLDAGWISRELVGFEAEAEKASLEKLTQLTREVGAKDCNVQVIFGVPSLTIKEQAEQLSADLIVLGTHGRHGLGLMLGSTANGVLHGTPCDVLAVRIDQDAS